MYSVPCRWLRLCYSTCRAQGPKVAPRLRGKLSEDSKQETILSLICPNIFPLTKSRVSERKMGENMASYLKKYIWMKYFRDKLNSWWKHRVLYGDADGKIELKTFVERLWWAPNNSGPSSYIVWIILEKDHRFVICGVQLCLFLLQTL